MRKARGPQANYAEAALVASEGGNEGGRLRTAVTPSIQNRNASEVRYRESEREYSFHSCEKRDCSPARVLWLTTKWPSKKRWMHPAACVLDFMPSVRHLVLDEGRAGGAYSGTSR